ncbi:MAG: FAD-binding protein [Immundisolibacter sp.]|uniref:FAD-binding protein n=1 Tax=Immundisolibacter sp. TaxID=1934948 RepID=UPI003EDEC2B7
MADKKPSADAVIIGGGLAGIVTAVELLEAGRRVIIVDRAEREIFGGQAREALGGMVFADTPEQRRMGLHDTPELLLEDWLRYSRLGADRLWPRAWAKAYAHEGTGEVYHWLRGKGLRFLPVVTWAERGLFEAGNSVARYILLWGGGYTLATRMIELLKPHQNRLTLLFRHQVQGFITTGTAVTGCHGVIEPSGEAFEISGAATVVATGGVGADLDRVRSLWPVAWGSAPPTILVGAHQYSDGQLHDQVRSIGGQVGDLSPMWNYATGIHHPKPRRPDHGLGLLPPRSALWLNYQGRRFDPPLMGAFDTTYCCQAVSQQQEQYSWLLLNRKMVLKEIMISGSEHNPYLRDRRFVRFLWENLGGNKRTYKYLVDECGQDVCVGTSARELAAKMNALAGNDHVAGDVLQQTMATYDAEIDKGPGNFTDPQLQRIERLRQWRGDRAKVCNFQKIGDPAAMPLVAVRQFILSRKSLGGVATNLQGQVLGTDGSPMPGLYAVGEAAGFGGGGASGERSLEGTFLAGCILTGRYAGRAIARG